MKIKRKKKATRTKETKHKGRKKSPPLNKKPFSIKPPTGRKKINISKREVQKLAGIGCTNCEIADFYGCDESTIRKRFSEIITKGHESGKMRLRKKQMQVALKGNVSMLIWLGKQMLGQKDKIENELSGKDGKPIPVQIVGFENINDTK